MKGGEVISPIRDITCTGNTARTACMDILVVCSCPVLLKAHCVQVIVVLFELWDKRFFGLQECMAQKEKGI